MTVRWTVRAATGFSAEKRIPLAINNRSLKLSFFVLRFKDYTAVFCSIILR